MNLFAFPFLCLLTWVISDMNIVAIKTEKPSVTIFLELPCAVYSNSFYFCKQNTLLWNGIQSNKTCIKVQVKNIFTCFLWITLQSFQYEYAQSGVLQKTSCWQCKFAIDNIAFWPSKYPQNCTNVTVLCITFAFVMYKCCFDQFSRKVRWYWYSSSVFTTVLLLEFTPLAPSRLSKEVWM